MHESARRSGRSVDPTCVDAFDTSHRNSEHRCSSRSRHTRGSSTRRCSGPPAACRNRHRYTGTVSVFPLVRKRPVRSPHRPDNSPCRSTHNRVRIPGWGFLASGSARPGRCTPMRNGSCAHPCAGIAGRPDTDQHRSRTPEQNRRYIGRQSSQAPADNRRGTAFPGRVCHTNVRCTVIALGAARYARAMIPNGAAEPSVAIITGRNRCRAHQLRGERATVVCSTRPRKKHDDNRRDQAHEMRQQSATSCEHFQPLLRSVPLSQDDHSIALGGPPATQTTEY